MTCLNDPGEACFNGVIYICGEKSDTGINDASGDANQVFDCFTSANDTDEEFLNGINNTRKST
jgi:hypothetical protein